MLDFEIHWDKYEYGDKHIHGEYKPIPASKMLPDWFKKLDPTSEKNNNMTTAKRCRGIYDILASGYMFLWPFDAEIIKDQNGRLTVINARNKGNDKFHPHDFFQVEGYPDINLEFQAHGIQKVTTPYRIQTPPGTSILVKQPPYRPELRTEIMEGIIDTDGYYGEFNILFIIKKLNFNRNIIIKAGTPLAQIIPFVRGEWNIQYGNIDKDKKIIFDDMAEDIDKFYQKNIWDKKIYKEKSINND